MPIQQHPIPQEVAGYKFRLIGDMTVKQFVWLAAGIILGIIFYSLPLPFFFKYPLAAISVALGAGSAFLPIQGRPMDKWLIAFIKSIYSPTQYVWKKSEAETTTVKAVIPPSKVEGGQGGVLATPKVGLSAVVEEAVPTKVGTEETQKTQPPTPPPQPIPLATPATAKAPTPTPTPPRSTAVLSPAPSRSPFGDSQSGPAPDTQRLPIPFTPTAGNTLVGMTLTPEGKILPATLVEIKLRGNTIRATRSNQLGQFLFAKPLDNGLYQIATEKEGYTFDTYSIDLKGQVVKPLKLQAKSTHAG